MFQQTAFGRMVQDIVERQAIVFRSELLDTSSNGAASTRGNKLPVLNVVKQSSRLGTRVPESADLAEETTPLYGSVYPEEQIGISPYNLRGNI